MRPIRQTCYNLSSNANLLGRSQQGRLILAGLGIKQTEWGAHGAQGGPARSRSRLCPMLHSDARRVRVLAYKI